jgi:acyl carrier protein
MYRTSDLCRYRADGSLEFLGRGDDQIKIRGYRVEPGEIEAVLRSHPAVEHAVVVARVLDPGDVRLSAHILVSSPRAGTAALAQELQRLVESQLPAYMVPSAFAFPTALPLTLSGKVDRSSLRSWEAAGYVSAAEDDTAPRTPLEAQVATLFGEVLGVASVGIRAGFFELGGHSLLAARLVTRLWDATGVRLRFKDFFQAPTVADVAERIAEEGRRREQPTVTEETRALVGALPEYELDALLRQHGSIGATKGDRHGHRQ